MDWRAMMGGCERGWLPRDVADQCGVRADGVCVGFCGCFCGMRDYGVCGVA